MERHVIKISEQFTRFPAGRYRSDGPYSGERFREDLLLPAMRSGQRVTVDLDGTMGYGSSFLEEVFGGLIRKGYFTSTEAMGILALESRDRSLVDEIVEYITATRH